MKTNKISTRVWLNWTLVFAFLFLVAVLAPAYGQYYPYGLPARIVPVHQAKPGFWSHVWLFLGNIWQLHLGGFFGALLGAFWSQKFKPYRRYFWWTLFALGVIQALVYSSELSYAIGFVAGAILAWLALRVYQAGMDRDTTFGSARWADRQHLEENGLIGSSGLYLGHFESSGKKIPLHYTGDRHLLTVGATRSMKGVAAIIPNLLAGHVGSSRVVDPKLLGGHGGSVLVVDPKGENALITAARRGDGDPARNIPGMGQKVHVVDPWGITGLKTSCLNPLDWLDPNDPDVSENAFMLMDAIVPPHQGSTDPFWDIEAKSLGVGVALFVALDENEADRNLGRFRDLIAASDEEFDETLARMYEHPNPIVRSAAARTASKDPKLRAGIRASLQSHTHFLESPRIRESLKRSDFRFEDLKSSRMTVYLVLPADRLEPFARWLRMLVQQAITVNARNVAVTPEKPVLFLLDEMGALGRLTAVEQAYSLMAGFGMQLWGIVQDLPQLERVYEKGWESFVANSGVLQLMGSRDQRTSEYFSKLCGVTTIRKFSFSRAISQAFSSAANGGTTTTTSDTHSADVVQRPLAFPDELMTMRRDRALVLVENFNPIPARKLAWFNDEKLKHLGVNLRQENDGAKKGQEFQGEQKPAA